MANEMLQTMAAGVQMLRQSMQMRMQVEAQRDAWLEEQKMAAEKVKMNDQLMKLKQDQLDIERQKFIEDKRRWEEEMTLKWSTEERRGAQAMAGGAAGPVAQARDMGAQEKIRELMREQIGQSASSSRAPLDGEPEDLKLQMATMDSKALADAIRHEEGTIQRLQTSDIMLVKGAQQEQLKAMVQAAQQRKQLYEHDQKVRNAAIASQLTDDGTKEWLHKQNMAAGTVVGGNKDERINQLAMGLYSDELAAAVAKANAQSDVRAKARISVTLRTRVMQADPTLTEADFQAVLKQLGKIHSEKATAAPKP